MSNVE